MVVAVAVAVEVAVAVVVVVVVVVLVGLEGYYTGNVAAKTTTSGS